MATYAGRKWTRGELLARVGDPQQVAGARSSILTEGKADGVRAVDVTTGSGFNFTVLPGRGMDLPYASHKGKAIGFVSGTGITSPAYYEEQGLEWRRSFFAGMLTTCGIANAGAPSVDQGKAFGLHGRLSNAAAENICTDQEWEGDEYVIRLKGTMREAEAMVENLSLTRTIETRLGDKGLRIRDTVRNRGFAPQPLMLLYHFNCGFPLLGTSAKVVGPITKTVPRDDEARKDRGVEECLAFPEPVQGYAEKVFFHTLAARKDGRTFIALVEPGHRGRGAARHRAALEQQGAADVHAMENAVQGLLCCRAGARHDDAHRPRTAPPAGRPADDRRPGIVRRGHRLRGAGHCRGDRRDREGSAVAGLSQDGKTLLPLHFAAGRAPVQVDDAGVVQVRFLSHVHPVVNVEGIRRRNCCIHVR